MILEEFLGAPRTAADGAPSLCKAANHRRSAVTADAPISAADACFVPPTRSAAPAARCATGHSAVAHPHRTISDRQLSRNEIAAQRLDESAGVRESDFVVGAVLAEWSCGAGSTASRG